MLFGNLPDEWVVDCRHVGKGAPAQGLQAGSGLWFFTWQCQEITDSDTTHFESNDHRQTHSAQAGVYLRQVPITDANPGLYPACLAIRVAQVKLQTRHSLHTGDRRYFMTITNMFD